MSGRNYVKFDFNNIVLTDMWDKKIVKVKDLILDFISTSESDIFDKVYVPDKLNFYQATCKLTSLDEIYILLLFVNSENLVDESLVNNLYNHLTTNTKFSNLVLCYQITTSSTKPKATDPIYFPSNNRSFQICESIEDSKEIKYKIYVSPNSFTQSNYSAMIQVYCILNTLPKTDSLHYYGRGMTPILIYLNNNYKSLFGYCGCKIAYDDGKKTIEESKLSNIHLILDKNREEFFKNIKKESYKDSKESYTHSATDSKESYTHSATDSKESYTHSAIISASRNGFGELDKVIDICKPLNKCKLIYIACNMKSFLKEIKDLPISYKILGEVDMFPGTAFIETIIEINL